MAVTMVAGNQPAMRMPHELFRGIRTMTANIVMEMGYSQVGSLHQGALIATGVVLFIFVLIINTLFSMLNREKSVKDDMKKEAAEATEIEQTP
jgi:phosphate transport system permease protein